MEKALPDLRKGYAGPLILLGGFLACWSLFQVLPSVGHVCFLGFFGIVLAAVLRIPIRLLERFLPRWAAALAVLVSAAAILAGLIWIAVPEMIAQGRDITRQAGVALDRIQAWLRRISSGSALEMITDGDSDLGGRIRQDLAGLAAKVVPLALGTLAISIEAFATVVVAIFLSVNPNLYRNGMIRLFPREKEATVSSVMEAMGHALNHWAAGTLISMLFIGAFSAAGLFLIGVPGWLTLATIAFFGEFIPYAGPLISALPALAVGLAQSPMTALYVLILYAVIQQVEGHILQPIVMRKAVKIPPALLILWQIAFALGFNGMGLIVATPILAVLLAAIETGYTRIALGRDRT